MKIPIIDLKRQYSAMQSRIEEKVQKIFEDQAFILGKDLEILEKKIASFCAAKYAVGVNSGTDALILALEALGIKSGDEVITTPFTFMATAEAIIRVGAKPLFVDIEPKTYNINPELIEKAITKKTKAIVPVHLYGLCADMDPILEIAKKHELKVLEDSAQAIGSEYKGRRAGGIGDAAAISFYPGKNLGCFGDGGMAVTNTKEVYEKIKLLRNHGTAQKYYHKIIGYNSRLDNLQAAVLNIKLDYLENWIDERIENARFFDKELEKCAISTQHIPKGLKHSFHLYVIRSKKAQELVDYVNKSGIESRSYYPLPLHLQECFKFLGYKKGDFPESECLSREGFAIPIYPELTQEEKSAIVDVIKRFFNRK